MKTQRPPGEPSAQKKTAKKTEQSSATSHSGKGGLMRLLIVCALVVVLAVAALVQAQVQIPVPNSTPTVISGSDLGFQIDSTTGGIPTGKLVIKMNGRWVEPKYATGLRPLTSR